jgi:hypothetical protein
MFNQTQLCHDANLIHPFGWGGSTQTLIWWIVFFLDPFCKRGDLPEDRKDDLQKYINWSQMKMNGLTLKLDHVASTCMIWQNIWMIWHWNLAKHCPYFPGLGVHRYLYDPWCVWTVKGSDTFPAGLKMWYSPPNRAVSFEQRESPPPRQKKSPKKTCRGLRWWTHGFRGLPIVTCSDKSTKAGAWK